MNLDLYSVVIASVSSVFIMMLAPLMLWVREKSDSLRDWALGIFFISTGTILGGARIQYLPEFFKDPSDNHNTWTVLACLTMVTVGYVVIFRGLSTYFESNWHHANWILVFVSTFLYFCFMWPVRDPEAWSIVTSYSRFFICFQAAFLLLCRRKKMSPWAASLTIGPFVLQGTYMFARGTASLFRQHARFEQLTSPAMAYLVAALAAQALILGLMMLYVETLLKQLQDAASTDLLTGLHNRRSFYLLATQEIVNSRRNGTPLWALMVDIDHFKSVNDQYGHATGDRVLCEVGLAIKQVLRSGDIGARYGGEEFCVILAETDDDEARAVAARLHASVSSIRRSKAGNAEFVTLSIGAARLQSSDRDIDQLLGRADVALYQAKNSGRNRSVGLDTEDVRDRNAVAYGAALASPSSGAH
jgi:diguanylate cyclase (GGDEF)-like protein